MGIRGTQTGESRHLSLAQNAFSLNDLSLDQRWVQFPVNSLGKCHPFYYAKHQSTATGFHLISFAFIPCFFSPSSLFWSSFLCHKHAYRKKPSTVVHTKSLCMESRRTVAFGVNTALGCWVLGLILNVLSLPEDILEQDAP